MTLLEDVQAPSDGRSTGPRCTVAILLESLAEPERSVIQSEIEGSRLTAKELAARLRRHDLDIGYYGINRHRRRECKCRS